MRRMFLSLCALIAVSAPVSAQEFASTTIDLGVVVSNLEKSAEFYTKVVGFKEVDGFSVPGDFAKEAGLTDGQPLKIRVFVLGEGASATKLKLMELPQTKPAPTNTQFIHSQVGFRYLTIAVADAKVALDRLEKNGVKTVSKGALPLPKGLPQDLTLTVFRDPDGNIIEFVGPKK